MDLKSFCKNFEDSMKISLFSIFTEILVMGLLRVKYHETVDTKMLLISAKEMDYGVVKRG